MTNSEQQHSYKELSAVVKDVEPKSHKYYISQFKDAVRDEHIDAFPVETNFPFGTGKLRCTEHLIISDDRFDQWHDEVLKKIALKQKQGSKSRVYKEDVLAGKVDLAKQLEIYRKELRSRSRKNPKRKPKMHDAEPIQAGVEKKSGRGQKNVKAESANLETSTSANANQGLNATGLE